MIAYQAPAIVPRTMAGHRLVSAGLAEIVEERGYWVIGRLITDPPVLFELSTESVHLVGIQYRVSPDVPVTYLGLYRNGKVIAEFQLGTWPVKPAPDVFSLLSPFLHALRGAIPVSVPQPPAPSLPPPGHGEVSRSATTRRRGPQCR